MFVYIGRGCKHNVYKKSLKSGITLVDICATPAYNDSVKRLREKGEVKMKKVQGGGSKTSRWCI